jgi:hypothetical protein
MKMARTPAVLKLFVILAALAAGAILLLPPPASAQEEVASAIRRYKDREASTGYYEEYEVRPRRQRPFVEIPGVQVGLFPYSPTAAEVRIRTRLVDSHMGIAFYKEKTCQACHPEQAKDMHSVRANLTCRQCHGGEPIASIQYFNSPMNPIRKHAYVCAKCHEGSSASFASYIIHEPAPGSVTARKSFPLLYFVYWFMTVLLVGTLAFFIPHSFLTGLRELFTRKKEAKNDADTTH